MSETQQMLDSLSDDQLRAAMEQALEDCKQAGATEKESEWHQACFAAVVIYSQEVGRRGLHVHKLH